MSIGSWFSPIILKRTLQQILGSRRTLFTIILSFLPIIVMVGLRFIPQRTNVVNSLLLETTIIFYLMFIVILVALFQSTTLLSDEIEGQTIVYLLMRPISKMTILLSKFLAYWIGSAIPVVISHLLIMVIIVTHPKSEIGLLHLLRLEVTYLSTIIFGLLAYGSFFLFLSVCFRHSALWGLLVAFGWEKITLVLPGNIRQFSLIYYLQSVILSDNKFPENPWIFNQLPFQFEPISRWLAILIILLTSAFFLCLSVLVFQRREYVIMK